MTKYRTISIPTDLYELAAKYVKDTPLLAYSSVTEYIKDAIRRDLERRIIGKQP